MAILNFTSTSISPRGILLEWELCPHLGVLCLLQNFVDRVVVLVHNHFVPTPVATASKTPHFHGGPMLTTQCGALLLEALGAPVA